MAILERFRSKYLIDEASGCWVWTAGFVSKKSLYGQIKYQGKTSLAHRVSYDLYKGGLTPDMDVLHKCDNPSCVNPDHLFLGTHSDNMRDMSSKKRARPQGNSLNLTLQDLFSIKESNQKGKDLAKFYKVSPSTISFIRNGKYVGVVGIEKYLEKYHA